MTESMTDICMLEEQKEDRGEKLSRNEKKTTLILCEFGTKS